MAKSRLPVLLFGCPCRGIVRFAFPRALCVGRHLNRLLILASGWAFQRNSNFQVMWAGNQKYPRLISPLSYCHDTNEMREGLLVG
jgi:hypothetical protein